MNSANFFYSASTNAVYAEIDRDKFEASGIWPDDARLLSKQQFDDHFTAEPPEGKRRVAGKDGLPAWEDIPPPPIEERTGLIIAEKAARVAAAQEIITPLQYAVDLGMATTEERDQLNAWKKYCVLLMRVDPTEPDVIWPVMP